MIVIAIGPQNTRARQRDHGQDGRQRRQHQRPRAPHRRLDDRIPTREARGHVRHRSGRRRMTVLRMIMPASAISPSRATKPNGALNASSATARSISAERRRREHQEQAVEKLCSWIMSSVSMTRNISGKILNSATLALALSSTAPPTSMRMPGGSVAAEISSMRRLDLRRHVGCLHAGSDVGAHRQDHVAVAPPQDRLLELVVHARHLRDRNSLRPSASG